MISVFNQKFDNFLSDIFLQMQYPYFLPITQHFYSNSITILNNNFNKQSSISISNSSTNLYKYTNSSTNYKLYRYNNFLMIINFRYGKMNWKRNIDQKPNRIEDWIGFVVRNFKTKTNKQQISFVLYQLYECWNSMAPW